MRNGKDSEAEETKEDMKELLHGADLPDEDDEWEEPPSKKIKKQTDDDEVVEISVPKKKNKSKKKAAKDKSELTTSAQAGTKRVRFDLSKNKVTEFFKHGKVA